MSLGDEQGYTDYGDTGHTRTRLPEGDPYGGAPRRGGRRSSSRSLVTVVGVVVLLIAAIAFANRGHDASSDNATNKQPQPKAAPTTATGTKPVESKSTGVPTGFAHTEQGAQSAASNYAVALGSTGMFRKDSRHTLLDLLYTSDAASRLQAPMDQAYSAEFLGRMGLDASGNPPKGSTFVSRVVPIGTTVRQYQDDRAKVAVWYLGLIGMAGNASTDPVTSTWKTWTFDLRWSDGDWKIASDAQKDGPAPVPGDDKAATSDEISKATEEYGGFTYAR
ncbi:hypothetical protein [Streptomyces collinus]|uniref:Integral membrane protein n=1 Tax=Streptomyces collinus (strain DSM 40733 / Tue 365) TaxID=1214242 RepID=S5VIU4_STRC3|nr:hypothetical protein [Streptomyces collinus]AGS70447.1 integral membrane protein [Streptomyces collinus Tu 365]UJA09090.1 hypothetical protein HGI10_30180 [Streptomyces collinus]UJA16046.1 hypothetical protein HGI09_33940 [Streptomyces collinus]